MRSPSRSPLLGLIKTIWKVKDRMICTAPRPNDIIKALRPFWDFPPPIARVLSGQPFSCRRCDGSIAWPYR